MLVVDDASPDGTGPLVESTFALDRRVRVIHRRGPRGLARSILDGLRAAAGLRVLVMDADFNHDPADLPRLLAAEASSGGGAAIVSGSRFLPGGGMYSAARLRGSRWMNRLARRVLRVPATDFLAGFFVVERARLGELPLDRIFHGYGDFYIRLLFEAHARGWTIVERPVRYPPRRAGRSKTPLARMALRYATQIFRIRMVGI